MYSEEERKRDFDIVFSLIVIIVIVIATFIIGLFSLIYSKIVIYESRIIEDDRGKILKSVEQDLLRHGKIGKIVEERG